MRIKLLFLTLSTFLIFCFPVFSQQEMVRMVYFYGKDRPIDRDATRKKMDNLAEILVSFYDGLIYEKSGDEFVVHFVQGKHEAGDYILNFESPENQILAEIREEMSFNLFENIYLVVTNVDAPEGICGSGGIVPQTIFRERSSFMKPSEMAWAFVYEESNCVSELLYFLAAHELGHALGLGHDFSNRNYIMSYGVEEVTYPNDVTVWRTPYLLSDCSKEWLRASRFFTQDPLLSRSIAPGVIEFDGLPEYNWATNELHVLFTGAGVPNLHQVQLHLIPETIPEGFFPNDPDRHRGWNLLDDWNKLSLYKCRTFDNNETNRNQIVFENVNFSNTPSDVMFNIQWIDTYGNITSSNFTFDAMEITDISADVNGDGTVNVIDLVIVAANFGVPDATFAQGDVNEDGTVDREDILIVLEALETQATVGAPNATITIEFLQRYIDGAKQLNNTDATFQKGIVVLEHLLAMWGEAVTVPDVTALLTNYPNPFNPETWIPYQLAKAADVTLTIYDVQGRVVRDLDLGHQHAGMYHNRSRAAYWDGKNALGESVASGVYFYTLTAGDFTATRKMLIKK